MEIYSHGPHPSQGPAYKLLGNGITGSRASCVSRFAAKSAPGKRTGAGSYAKQILEQSIKLSKQRQGGRSKAVTDHRHGHVKESAKHESAKHEFAKHEFKYCPP